ncbi:MAG TPA: class I SAM-dependent methyltransferase family protein [Nitrososphaerales archaeon]|nr:class I SAM-dependent methyltransferase family protein [Nitrososphaerales archaeon]
MPMLKAALRFVLTDEEIRHLSSSFDVIGDIAIIKIPPELSGKESLIGEELLQKMKNVVTVLKQESDVKGEYRVREVSIIAGKEKYDTIYRENGVAFKVDVRSVYFSPRLSTERARIRSLVAENETILNMFAGVGTFSFIIAKSTPCTIHSVDLNPEAIRLAEASLLLNRKMKGKVLPILADANSYSAMRPGEFDRILMPLPERAREFLPSAVSAAKEKGAMIHYYVHVPQDDFTNKSWIEKHLEELHLGRKFKVLLWKRVREVGPRYIQAVADIKVI